MSKNINVSEFERKTREALLKQLNHSRDLIDRFDPDFEDIEGRKAAQEVIDHWKEVIAIN